MYNLREKKTKIKKIESEKNLTFNTVQFSERFFFFASLR